MGAVRTENTKLGRRAVPLIKQLRRLIRHIELHPPAGVDVHGHGSKNRLSPHGFIGKHLWEYVNANELWTDNGFKWKDAGAATNYLYRTCVAEKSFGRLAAWDWIEAWMPSFRAYLRELEAKPVAADDEDTRGVEERHLHAVPESAFSPEAGSEPPRPLWSDDPEIDAMSKVKDAMEPLDKEQRTRVLRYIAERYGVADA